MSTMVFDIETTAQPVENFDEVQQEYLFREAESQPDEVSRERKRAEISNLFSLWALTGQVVSIGMMNPHTLRGKSLYLADDFEETPPGSDVEFIPCPDEAELLASFWEAAAKFDTVVTFNGRSFDVPFLYLRSAVLNVPISRKDWLGYRYQESPHCDLLDQLTFYNVSGRTGAARTFNLDFYCKVLGIVSPKAQGVTGHDVPRMMEEGRYREIAEYCMRDVRATVELYRVWNERLRDLSSKYSKH
ncbi:MAG: ribonuclease H-like domain-containing protein [Verrucomicrobia bacterium]|nr:ribonuclease H-like domain-containing protein [Verrucomicrobiota bacterium]